MDTPKTLKECFDALDNMDVVDSIRWLAMNETQALAQAHHGFGTTLRNNWGLWDENSELYKYFKEMGLFHADDMSSVILKSYHRYKNGKDQKIDEQIKRYQEYWADMNKSKGNSFEPADDILY